MGDPNEPYNYGGRVHDAEGNVIADYSRGIIGGGNQMGGLGAWTPPTPGIPGVGSNQ